MAILVNELWTANNPALNWDYLYREDWAEHAWLDWYFRTDYYISAPTSIWLGDPYKEIYVLSKHAEAQNLKAGRITCWVRSQIAGVGQPNVYIGVTGVGDVGIRLQLIHANKIWYRTRFTWWQENGQTAVKKEIWDGSNWVEGDTDYYDPMTGDTNRVGIGSQPQSVGDLRWYDDTIIEIVTILPTVTTDPAVVNATLADLNGTLSNDGGEACDCGFQWGETIAYEHGATPPQTKTTGQSFSQIIEGLSPSTTYHFKAFATNAAGTSHGADVTLTTEAAIPDVIVPTVDTIGAASITPWSGTVLGRLTDDGGEACEVRFQWGETIAYGNNTSWQTGKITGDDFEQTITGLDPYTLYHFRAQAKNTMGIASGVDMTFMTIEAPVFSRAYALAREEL